VVAPAERRSSSTHWPALDGFRGATIWAAVSVHAGYLTANGILSLTTFFVLSGFLITGLLLREFQRHDRIALGAFWARRARRLLPGLFVVLLAVVLYGALVDDPVGLDRLRMDIASAVGYFTNWHFIASDQSYFANFSTPSPILHLWSLAVEEQFYLVWPLIVFGVLKLSRGSVRALAWVAGIGALASAVWMAVLYVPGGDPSRVYYGSDTRAQAMLCGALLAVLVNRRGPVRSALAQRALPILGALGFVVLAVPWFMGSSLHDTLYGWSLGELVYSLVTVVVLWSLVQPRSGPLGAVLSMRPVRWVGDISYEMYLWHWPLYLVLDRNRTGLDGTGLFVFRLGVLVVLAALTHFLLGEPIRRGTFLRSPRLARASVAVAAGVAIVGASFVAANAPPAISGDFGELAGGVRVAAARSLPPPKKPAPTVSNPTEPLKVMVVGDSQAITLAQGVVQESGLHGLSAQPGLNVWNRAVLGCAVERSDLLLASGPAKNACGDRWWSRWQADIDTFQPAVIFAWESGWDMFDRVVNGQVVKETSAEYASLYRADLQTLVDILKSRGAIVVFMVPACFGVHEVTGVQAPERLDPQRLRVLQRLVSGVANKNGVHLYDMNDQLCPGGENDGVLRPDGTHVGNEGSDVVAPRLARYLLRLAARGREDPQQGGGAAGPPGG
jgi:peptidoglycan/LPS O-acetylase OafA/YrhL